MGWFDISTLKEPYRIEGKKTMGLELAQQFDWRLPDVIIYPTGGGTGLIGMWKAFAELKAIGWLDSEKMPRMVSVQSDGSRRSPRHSRPASVRESVPERGHRGERAACSRGRRRFHDPRCRPRSNGVAIAVKEERIVDWMKLAVSSEGIGVCPESAACVGAAETLRSSGWIKPDEEVLIFNCAPRRSILTSRHRKWSVSVRPTRSTGA